MSRNVLTVGEILPETLDALRVELAARLDSDDWRAPSERERTGWHEGYRAARIVLGGRLIGPPAPSSLALAQQLAEHLDGQLCSVWWASLEPGGQIDEHSDSQPWDGFARLHVPIESDGTSRFVSDGQSHELEPGWAYLVDVLEPHSVEGPAHRPRVHLCIDLKLSADSAEVMSGS